MTQSWRTHIIFALLMPLWAHPAPVRAGGLQDVHFFASTEGAAAVKAAMAETGATSVALALVNGRKFVWEEAFGFADAAGEGPGARLIAANSDTRFGVGEVGRILATVAVLKLAEEGRFSLDTPVAAHLPAFRMLSPEYRHISVRMLLGQTSGIPGTDPRSRFTSVPFAGYAGQVLDGLALQRLNHLPGILPVPCGDGFTVLQELVQAVTGVAYIDYAKREILDPLGMRHCDFIPAPRPQNDPYARAFDGMRRCPLEFANAYASCGFYSSAPDMARLMSMLLDGGSFKGERILSEETVKEMGRQQLPPEAEPLPSPFTAFGLGWDTVCQPALRAAGYEAWAIRGQTPHYASAMILIPSERMGIFVAGATKLKADALVQVAERILIRALVEKGSIPEMPAPPGLEFLAEIQEEPRAFPDLPGIYSSREHTYRVRPGRFTGTLDLDLYEAGASTWKHLASDMRPRTDGWFIPGGESGTAYAFLRWQGRLYLALRTGSRFSIDSRIVAERVTTGGKPSGFWESLRGGTWVLVNESLDSELFIAAPFIALKSLPGLPNPLFVHTVGAYPLDFTCDACPGTAMLRIPGPAGQDLNEVWAMQRGEEVWLRCAGRVFRPLATVPLLRDGENPLATGKDGHVDWRAVPAGVHHLAVNGFAAWALFDSTFGLKAKHAGPGTVTVHNGLGVSFLALHGPPGCVGSVRMR
ncbi:serine hydrolase [Geothrix sp. 21YS21S-2]|uniref:serine hydrolase domain-containing protein n=1 Tax=Geothrix sp. 21YS21S-2 TaxID=3068893 RepID=UPI0027B9D5F1|nr:serine hydrolase domain-containing protein [Geothrix sp. 21YS21S-2]